MADYQRLQVQPEAVRARARALRQWAAQWAELEQRAQAVGRQLAEAVRAVPGERFGTLQAAQALHRRRVGERAQQLAEVLEAALERLEQAFQEAAQGIRSLSAAAYGPLPEVPLAVDANGRPIANQFEIWVNPEILRQAGVPEETIARLQDGNGRVRWYAACGPVALSVALSRSLGRPIPAQEVVDRMLTKRIANKAFRDGIRDHALHRERPGVSFYTGREDLTEAARLYGAEAKEVSLPDGQRDPEALWRSLKERTERNESLMMLVRVPKVGNGKLVPYTIPHDSSTVPHWVTVAGVEEGVDGRYITLYNPYYNARERYRWEEFLASVDGQVRGSSWWALSVRGGETGGRP